VLDELAKRAGDERARNLAGRVLEAIAGRATSVEGGVHWHDMTEIMWGTAGIGCVMLTLGAEYLGPSAIELAVRAGDWLLSEAEELPEGSVGRMARPMRRNIQRTVAGTPTSHTAPPESVSFSLAWHR